jgi:hypothetical protein
MRLNQSADVRLTSDAECDISISELSGSDVLTPEEASWDDTDSGEDSSLQI